MGSPRRRFPACWASRSRLSAKWETGRSTPDPQTLARVAAYFKVSTDYLLGCAPAPITSAVAAADGPREFPIPIIGTVRAGFGAFAFEEDYGEEYARVKDPGSYFYLLVKGDSMEPRISDGDLALVHRQPTLENGDLGVVIFGEGEGTLKKIHPAGQHHHPAALQQCICAADHHG